MRYSDGVRTISTEVATPVPAGVPVGASARIVALPFGRFKVRVRDGLLAASVGAAWLRVEGAVVRLSTRRPPRWSTVLGLTLPLGFVVAAALLLLGTPWLAPVAAGATLAAIVAITILRRLLAESEETVVYAADAYVVAIKRPLGLDRIAWLLRKVEPQLPHTLSDLIGRRVVVVEASFGRDRLSIQRRALVARRVATAEALVRSLRTARQPRPRA
jgi:acyl dehydratase